LKSDYVIISEMSVLMHAVIPLCAEFE